VWSPEKLYFAIKTPSEVEKRLLDTCVDLTGNMKD